MYLSLTLALGAAVALGYDSQVTEKATYQVLKTDLDLEMIITPKVAVFTAELPVVMRFEAPDLGKRSPQNAKVSEKLASGVFISARPPPDTRPKIS